MSNPIAANTPLAISSRACALVGCEPITSFEDGSAEATVLANVYEDVIQSALAEMRWGFASGQVVLNRLAAAPKARWSAAYQIPSPLITIHTVTVGDQPIPYDVLGDQIVCDAGVDDVVTLDYTYRESEAKWPPYFKLWCIFQLASILAASVTRQSDLAAAYDKKAVSQLLRSKLLDKNRATSKPLQTKEFVKVRWGRGR